MTGSTATLVDIDKVAIDDGLNPRSDFDPDRMAELEASIRENGIVTALTVRSDGNGGYLLVAGERRLRAARNLGLGQVPVLVRQDDGLLSAAIAENLIREDLDPVEQAHAFQALAKSEKLRTRKALAARLGKSISYVNERMRLLALPEAVQRHIASGAVPVAAERELREVCKVSPRIAECACELAARGEVEGRDLVESFGHVLAKVSRTAFDPPLTMISVDNSVPLGELVEPGERQDTLAARYREIDRGYTPVGGDEVWLRLTGDDIDAARAAGCLLEYTEDEGGWDHTRQFLCDRELATDIAERIVEREEKRAADRTEVKDTGEAGIDEKEVRRQMRERAEEEAAAASGFNISLGRKLIARRGAKTRREHSLARAKAVAKLVLSDHERLAAAGLRLVLPQLQDVEVKILKSGEDRRRRVYAQPEECASYLANRIDEAKSANEVLELLADALIAALLADHHALPQSRRVPWWSHASGDIAELLATDIKAVKPRRAKRDR